MIGPLPASLIRNFSYRMHRLRYGVDAAGHAVKLREIQWYSTDDLRDYQDQRVRDLIRHASIAVPYYRDLLAQHGVDAGSINGVEDLCRIPTLSKAEIRAHHTELIAEGAGSRDLKRNSTGGSTGENLTFFQDRSCRGGILGTQIMNFEWMGAQFGDPVAYLWGSPIETRRSRAVAGQLKNALQNVLYLSCFGLDEAMILDYEARIRSWEPRILIGYPSALSMFARSQQARGAAPLPVNGIICTSEVLLPEERALIESALGAGVFNRYGCREVGDIAHECGGHTGLHVNSGRMVVELGDADPDGFGEVIVTDLDNYTMPFIRYRMGDLAAWDPRECSCGRQLPMLREIAGRKFDLVVSPNGSTLPGTFWTHLFRSRPGVLAFQVRQTHPDRVVVLLVEESPGSTVPHAEWFVAEVGRIAGSELQVELRTVDEIPTPASGKRRFVINEVGR